MKLGAVTKSPAERLSVSILYTEALDPGDTISRIVAHSVAPSGELLTSAFLAEPTRVRVWLESGVAGVSYNVTTLVETTNGERFEDTIVCKVK